MTKWEYKQIEHFEEVKKLAEEGFEFLTMIPVRRFLDLGPFSDIVDDHDYLLRRMKK